VTANVNGIRAALKRGGLDWLAACGADVLCLQEVRATPGQVAEALGAGGLGAWHLALAEGQRSGHAGVALLSRTPLADVAVGPGPEEFADQGRWVEATVPDPDG
jgi:exodeoxyribonuclease-3